MKGFIKDYRQEVKSDIWLMPPMYHRVWQYLKYMVNHEDNEIPMRDGSKMKIKKGQHLTSVRGVCSGVGYYEGAKWKEPNPKTISAVLDWLVKQNMISIDKGKGNRQYTLITLINWELYQQKESEGNSKYTPSKQSMDINKNDKNEKEEIPYVEIIDYLNLKSDSSYKHQTKKTKELIKARFKEGFTFEDFTLVIDHCCENWKGKVFNNGQAGDDYLRPSTLFNNKFDERVNLAKKPKVNVSSHKNQNNIDWENL